MSSTESTDEKAIRDLVENWARSVRAKDFNGILAHHSEEMIMFDVPPPFESKGIEEYKKTWNLFFSSQREPIKFDIQRMDVVAGPDVAFVSAHMQCEETDKTGEWINLDFRLTVGLKKINGEWTILHEHHSVPAS